MTTTAFDTTAALRRTALATRVLLAGVGIAIGAAALAPVTAQAAKISEKTIKSECQQANGAYDSSVKNGVRTSHCSYADNDGATNVDIYVNGEYVGTSTPGRIRPVAPTIPMQIADPSTISSPVG